MDISLLDIKVRESHPRGRDGVALSSTIESTPTPSSSQPGPPLIAATSQSYTISSGAENTTGGPDQSQINVTRVAERPKEDPNTGLWSSLKIGWKTPSLMIIETKQTSCQIFQVLYTLNTTYENGDRTLSLDTVLQEPINEIDDCIFSIKFTFQSTQPGQTKPMQRIMRMPQTPNSGLLDSFAATISSLGFLKLTKI
ncbi:hypothetical protein G7Y89_g12066 [Cudoniella acicularis]|uniref:Uncharacterized protein n=1 Tax=Cudoniella acicularis TaxID=354080 RepID=A0A8H4RC98_9HELO|nr:hypothetical protein G7Y89_g12066 [Cudoniella acicularis]